MFSVFLLSIETLVKVWENSKSCGNTRLRLVFPLVSRTGEKHGLVNQGKQPSAKHVLEETQQYLLFSLQTKEIESATAFAQTRVSVRKTVFFSYIIGNSVFKLKKSRLKSDP